MSKKKKKKKNYTNYTKKKAEQDVRMEVLKNMLECGKCADAGNFIESEFDTPSDRVQYCVENLPGFGKAEEQFINYIFADGMSAGGVSEDAKLDSFRFSVNEQDVTNNSVLRDAIRLAHCRYGECGIRWKDGNVYLYKAGTYAPLTLKNEGMEEVLAYIATKDGDLMPEREYDLKSIDTTLFGIEEYLDRQGLILLDKSEFINLRNDTSKLHGAPPLEKDKLRIDLLINVYERLNYDVTFDGPGRLLMPVKNGYVGDEDNASSTTKIIKEVSTAEQRNQDALSEVERIARNIKESSSDAVIAVSGGFGEPIKLPRVTKATEFLDWLKEKEGEILSDIIGLPPSLLEEGELSGNVSMTRIVDNAMLNSVVPFREHYASQLSPLLSPKLSVQKVYFSTYVLQSEESPTQKWLKIATTMQQLNTIEDIPEVKDVIRTFAEMLTYDTHDSVGGIVELAEDIKKDKEKEKKSWLKRLSNR